MKKTKEDLEDIELESTGSKHINVKLEKFEGPFDLLFHLIRKNEIDIYDIPISMLTEQYLESIKDDEIIDMDNMSEFLLMAATLLEIKSRLLLPKKQNEEEETINPREELANKLLEYQYFKNLSEIMAEQFKNPIITKEMDLEAIKNLNLDFVEMPEAEELLNGITLERLYDLFKDVVLRQENKVDKVRSTYGKIQRENFTIESKKEHIRELLRSGKELVFFEIFAEDSSKSEKITTFLAVLELIKIKEIFVEQKNNFGDIVIKGNNEVQNES